MINTAKLRAKKVWYNTLTVAGVRLDPSVSCKCRLHAVTIKPWLSEVKHKVISVDGPAAAQLKLHISK